MSNLILLLLNFLLTILEEITLYFLGRCFFKNKYRGARLCGCMVALIIMQIFVYLVSQKWNVLRYGLIVVINTVWVWMVYRPKLVQSFTISILYLSIMMAGDSLFLMGFCTMTGLDAEVYLQNPYAYYAFCYIIKIFELFLIVVLRLCMRKRVELRTVNWSDWVRMLSFPLMSIIIAIFLMQVYVADNASAPQILLCSIALIGSDFLAVTMLNNMEEQQQKLHDYSVLQHSIRIEKDNVTAWINAYSNQRKQTHEYQNQLAVIQGMAQKESPNGKLVEYVNQLRQTSLSDSLFIKTGRTVVDVILNQKNSIAQSKGIRFQLNLDDLTDFALVDTDLVVVLANLIDNAIEACEKIEERSQRIIKLSMRAEPEASFLRIENTTSEPVNIVDNMVLSTKGTQLEHGYGLKNISAILDRYDAIYALDYQPYTQIFCFSAQIIPPAGNI